jgi:hypothetical protein
MKLNKFKVKANVWRYDGPAAWYFVTLPQKESDAIKKYFSVLKRAWGSLPVKVKAGNTEWETSIFPDRKAGAYLLPIKSEIRKCINVSDGDMLELVLTVRL